MPSLTTSNARGGLPPGGRVRPHPLPRRLPSPPLEPRLKRPHPDDLHGRLDLPDLVPLYREFPEMPVVSISDCQRRPCRANWQGHRLSRPAGGPPFPPGGAEDYLAFLGRISPEKGVEIGHRDRPPRRPADPHRRQGRPRRPRVLRDARPSPALAAARGVPRRDRRAARELPRPCPRPALPDRLARAVRPGDGSRPWPAARRWSPSAADRSLRS